MIKVIQELKVHEVGGIPVKVTDDVPELRVCSHRDTDDLVVLLFRGESISVRSRELASAIDNARNTSRFG